MSLSPAAEAGQFPVGMRASGECPKHPGQPYYHCPACAKERQTETGNEILEVHKEEVRNRASEGEGLIVVECPVSITPPAVEKATIYLRDFCRHNPRTKLGELYRRQQMLVERENFFEAGDVQNLIDKLEGEGVVVYSEQVYLKVDIDITGTSGVTPSINIYMPEDREAFLRDFAPFVVNGLHVAVERRNMHFLRGLIIDWIEVQGGEGFSLRHSRVGE